VAVKLMAARSFGTLVAIQPLTRRDFLEGMTFRQCRCGNLKSSVLCTSWQFLEGGGH
jgi:hypothetical protein